jgi:glucose uptake protein
LGKKFGGSKIKKGIIFSAITGIIIGLFPLLLSLSMTPKGNLDSYSATFFFTIGALIVTFPVLYLISRFHLISNGKLQSKDFFPKKTSWYFWEIVAGVIWSIGTVLNFAAATVTGLSISFTFGNGSIMIAAIFGIFVLKELKNAPKKSWISIIFMFLFFITGLISLALAFK